MAATRVQHFESGGLSDGAGLISTLFPATATANNLIVAWANSDSTVALQTAGYTNVISDVNGNGCYVWYKVSAGSETSITFVTGTVSKPIVCGFIEYGGCATTSVVDTSTHAYAVGQSTTLSTLSATTTVEDLLVAFGNIKGLSNGLPTSPVWTNSITNFATKDSGGLTGADCYSMIGDLLTVAAGAQSVTGSWSAGVSTGNDRETNLVAFKIASGQIPTGSAAATGAGLAPGKTIATTMSRATGTGAALNAAANPTNAGAIGASTGTGAAQAAGPSVFVTAGWTRTVVVPFTLKDGTGLLLKTGESFSLKAS